MNSIEVDAEVSGVERKYVNYRRRFKRLWPIGDNGEKTYRV
jgi:hypothetical protein